MKHLFTLLAVAVAAGFGMSSCSSSRSAQTTDDIYYSSGGKRPVAAADKDEYYSTAPSDNYVRMKAQDPARWSTFDDYSAYDSYYAPVGASVGYGWGYPSYYGMGYGMGFGLGFGSGLGFWDPYSPWNSYYMWNSWYNPYFYNPYYGGAVFVVGHTPVSGGTYSNLRPFNSYAYRNGLSHSSGATGASSRFYRPGMSTTSNYNSALNGQGRQVNNTYYRPGNNNGSSYRPFNNNSSQPTRSYTPSSSFGSGTRSGGFSSGGGGGGGFSRPGRH
jgi:hypothetical protein